MPSARETRDSILYGDPTSLLAVLYSPSPTRLSLKFYISSVAECPILYCIMTFTACLFVNMIFINTLLSIAISIAITVLSTFNIHDTMMVWVQRVLLEIFSQLLYCILSL